MTDENDVVRLAIRCPEAFMEIELSYISNFVDGEKEAISWIQTIGLFAGSMAKHIESSEAMATFARFIPDREKKKEIREKVTETSKGAFIWGMAVPEDRELVKDKVKGSEWVYRWAKHIGDVEKMRNRIDHEYWQNKLKGEVINDGDASFH